MTPLPREVGFADVRPSVGAKEESRGRNYTPSCECFRLCRIAAGSRATRREVRAGSKAYCWRKQPFPPGIVQKSGAEYGDVQACRHYSARTEIGGVVSHYRRVFSMSGDRKPHYSKTMVTSGLG